MNWPVRSLLTEAAVLGVFLLGLAVARRLDRRWTWPEIAVMYAVGLLFEVLTAHMWRYHHILFVFPFRADDDISVLFPLGWAGLIMAATSGAERLWARWRVFSRPGRHLVLAGVWLLVGDASETTFYRIGMIEYVRDASTAANFVLGQVPGLPPTMVLLGYGLLQPFVSHFFRALEHSLRGGGPAAGRHRA